MEIADEQNICLSISLVKLNIWTITSNNGFSPQLEMFTLHLHENIVQPTSKRF